MKSYFHPILSVSIVLVLGACTQRAVQTHQPPLSSQGHLLHSTLFVQNSAEYDALCFQAFEIAKMRLEQILKEDIRNPAVVLDLDETVLDNSPYSAWQVIADHPFTDQTWDVWVQAAVAEGVPGAAGFLHTADSLGFTLFYISNREEYQLDATIKNMRALHLPQLDPSNFLLKTTTSDKSSRRQDVTDRKYNIVMYIGDNLGDFDEKWDKPASVTGRKTDVVSDKFKFGANYIILPNPIYGTWEYAIRQYRHDWNDVQLDSLRKANLNDFKLK